MNSPFNSYSYLVRGVPPSSYSSHWSCFRSPLMLSSLAILPRPEFSCILPSELNCSISWKRAPILISFLHDSMIPALYFLPIGNYLSATLSEFSRLIASHTIAHPPLPRSLSFL